MPCAVNIIDDFKGGLLNRVEARLVGVDQAFLVGTLHREVDVVAAVFGNRANELPGCQSALDRGDDVAVLRTFQFLIIQFSEEALSFV